MRKKLRWGKSVHQSIRGPKGWFLPQRKMEDVDQKNFLNLKKIVEKNGWPGFTTLGENNSHGKFDVTGSVTLLLLHFNSEQISFLKPYLIKAIAEMEIYPHHVARVFDYVYIKQGSRIAQLYGTYTMNGRTVEIDDLSTLNKRRADLGLESFEDYLRKRKISKN